MSLIFRAVLEHIAKNSRNSLVPVEDLLVNADHRAPEEHPVPAPHGHAAVPPRADNDVVRSAEAVEEGAGPGEVLHGRVHPRRVRQSFAPVLFGVVSLRFKGFRRFFVVSFRGLACVASNRQPLSSFRPAKRREITKD